MCVEIINILLYNLISREDLTVKDKIMRKKSLISEIERLINKNSELYNDNVSLSKNIEDKKQRIEVLENRISDLEKTIEAMKCDNSVVVSECDCERDGESTDSQDAQNSYDTYGIKTNECVDSDIDSAASVIGDVVLKCADLCNTFAAVGGSNAKDLVNLALGRTEVFKSEILQIITGNSDDEQKIQLINERVDSVNEYFDLLLKQI